MAIRRIVVRVVMVASCFGLSGQVSALADRPNWRAFAAQSDAWYRSPEGRRIARNILSHQSVTGAWPKNMDPTARPFQDDRSRIQGTFDNGATINEVRFLARAFRATNDEDDRRAVLKAVEHILDAQYTTGGWPQLSPPGEGYHRHITFNDDTMVNLMGLLREVASSKDFDFIDKPRRRKADQAFDAGIACILKCQVVDDGKKTVWCAQHDERTLEPRPARTFEPASLSGSESVGILLLLMTLERPSPEIIASVEAGVRWFDANQIRGIRQEIVNGDKRIMKDPSAPPLWARFYEIGTNRPIFCSRDGIVRYSLAEISPERRNGYSWYGSRGSDLLRRYSSWAQSPKN